MSLLCEVVKNNVWYLENHLVVALTEVLEFCEEEKILAGGIKWREKKLVVCFN